MSLYYHKFIGPAASDKQTKISFSDLKVFQTQSKAKLQKKSLNARHQVLNGSPFEAPVALMPGKCCGSE